MIAQATTFHAAGATPAVDLEAFERASAEQLEAFRKLNLWYNDWAATLRSVLSASGPEASGEARNRNRKVVPVPEQAPRLETADPDETALLGSIRVATQETAVPALSVEALIAPVA